MLGNSHAESQIYLFFLVVLVEQLNARMLFLFLSSAYSHQQVFVLSTYVNNEKEK